MSRSQPVLAWKRPIWKDWRLWVGILIVAIIIFSRMDTSDGKPTEEPEANYNVKDQENETVSNTLGVDRERFDGFIKYLKFVGLQKVNPDKKFFLHMGAPGFSIQFEGNSPETMTGIMVDLSYDRQVIGKGIPTVDALIDLVLTNQDDATAAQAWFQKQIVNAEINVRQGEETQESKLELNGTVLDFFPPTTLENLSATVLIYPR